MRKLLIILLCAALGACLSPHDGETPLSSVAVTLDTDSPAMSIQYTWEVDGEMHCGGGAANADGTSFKPGDTLRLSLWMEDFPDGLPAALSLRLSLEAPDGTVFPCEPTLALDDPQGRQWGVSITGDPVQGFHAALTQVVTPS